MVMDIKINHKALVSHSFNNSSIPKLNKKEVVSLINNLLKLKTKIQFSLMAVAQLGLIKLNSKLVEMEVSEIHSLRVFWVIILLTRDIKFTENQMMILNLKLMSIHHFQTKKEKVMTMMMMTLAKSVL